MSTQIMSPANQVAELEARLHTVEAERTEAVAKRATATQRLARAAADGAAEDVRGSIRGELRDLNARIEEIEVALPLIRLDLQPLEAKAAEASLVEAEAEADRLRDQYIEAVKATEATLRRMASEFLKVHGAETRAHTQALQARQAAIRAAGGDVQDAFYAEVVREPILDMDRDHAADYHTAVRTLVVYGTSLTQATRNP